MDVSVIDFCNVTLIELWAFASSSSELENVIAFRYSSLRKLGSKCANVLDGFNVLLNEVSSQFPVR
jgi:hypothetical protein